MKGIILFLNFSVCLLAQIPDPAFHPMTAPGAIGIHFSSHTLFWDNPSGVQYNECYFSSDSSLVANLDVSVRIQNGSPSTVYSSVQISSLEFNTRYYWRIVEYNASGNTPSPLWYFNTTPSPIFVYEYQFVSNLEGWQVIGPFGFNNWNWISTSAAGGNPGELYFRWDPVFIGDSYIISPEIPSPVGSGVAITFKFYEDWWSDTVVVGCAITYDNGLNWTTIWDLYATGNVGPELAGAFISASGNFRLGFFYKGNSDNIDFLYVDDVVIQTALSPPQPPSFLQAKASYDEQKVILNWNGGIGAPFVTGYYIERKNGLPDDTSSYVFIGQTNDVTHTFSDETVELNEVYTYRMLTLSGPFSSHYGNEATAYVPSSVPVELISFSADVVVNNVKLNWVTASEKNNSGFEIERRNPPLNPLQGGENLKWERIGFVNGKGTTTERQFYSFVDENLEAGKYQYRLKQIDFDGTFEYSNIVEAELGLPSEFSLSQNYPNPFNPSTKIKYSVPSVETHRNASLHVALKVYDVLGNEVLTLVNENQPAGNYEISFDASGLASGIYYYKLTAGNYSASKKLILIK